MNLTDKVFKISGHKLRSLLIGENAFLFSDQSIQTPPQFNQEMNKGFSLDSKKAIKFNSIKSITTEDAQKTISVNYKTASIITGNRKFDFPDEKDGDLFFNFLEKELYFKRTEKRLSPIKSASPLIFGLLPGIALALLAYFKPVDISDWAGKEGENLYIKIIKYIVRMIGSNGVFLTGILMTCFFFILYLESIHKTTCAGKIFTPR